MDKMDKIEEKKEKKCGCCGEKRSICKCSLRDLQMCLIQKQLGLWTSKS